MHIDKLEDTPEIVICTCVLHNICIAEHDNEGFLEDGKGDNDDEANDIFPPHTGGSDKRNMIMRLLH